ncbi:beta strand repeat-containing protein, partial [Ramlibacter sp. MAHUQ-53]|uniref:beta strand repeat-containing protein n=1 Tax=unclassified Ramlibacter TaxID=2617605 RepID=UPI00362A6259
MATIIAVDESSGTQNATQGGVTSYDTTAQIPDRFAQLLSQEAPGGGTPTSTALYGATTANTTGTAITTFTGAVSDIGFVADDSTPYDGDPTGLLTLTGEAVLLYTSTFDNNAIIGKTASGTIVFIAFLDTGVNSTDGTDVGATSAKLWLQQYEPLKHPDGTDANDVVQLADALNIAVDTTTNFSLAGAPAGQNLFLMFGDGSPSTEEVAIVVTGRSPATTGSLSSGDTVNTGNAGGTTTIGTNNQMIDPGEGMYFTFVKGPTTTYTVPNLDQNEADVAANIQFNEYYQVDAATFTVVQLQPPKGATLLLTAKLNGDNTEKGASFIPGYGNDDTINISSVTITRGTLVINFSEGGATSSNGITADFSGSTLKLTGVEAGDVVRYTTASLHDRLLVENLGNANGNLDASFDIGAFSIDTGSFATRELGVLAFVDDAPTASIERTLNGITLDESQGLDGSDGNAEDDDSLPVADPFTGAYGDPIGAVVGVDLVTATTSTGADSENAPPAAMSLSIVGGSGASSGLVTAAGVGINLYLEANGTVTGRTTSAAGPVIFAIRIDADGLVDVAQYAALGHPDDADPDDAVDLSGKLDAVITQQDGDDDVATQSVGIGDAIVFEDDGPSVSANGNVQLDDDALTGGNPGGTGDDANATNTSGTLGHDFGEDGAGTVAWLTTGAPTGFTYEADGTSLLVKQGGTTVLTLTLNPATGAYGVTQNAPIAHAAGDDENNVSFTVNYRVTDDDDDTADGTLVINVDDDTPEAAIERTANSVVLDESAGVDAGDANAEDDDPPFTNPFPVGYGTAIGLALDVDLVDTDSSVGADIPGTTEVTLEIVGGEGADSGLVTTAGAAITLWLESDGTVTGRTGGETGTVVFAIRINASGQVSVAQYATLGHPDDADHDDAVNLDGKLNAVITVVDEDDDEASDSVGIGEAIVFEDDGPSVAANGDVQLDDDALTGGNPDGTGDDANATNTSGTLGHDFGEDGAGTVAWLTTGAPTGFTYEA